IIVTHNAPDLDAITSVWLIKRFLPGWEDAQLQFVPAGERIGEIKSQISNLKSPIEKINEDEVIHVDTGLGPLDHHQIASDKVCAASLTWDYVKSQNPAFNKTDESDRVKHKEEALGRMVGVVVDDDHFKEIFYPDPIADYFEFLLQGVIDGIKLQKPGDDKYCAEFVSNCLDAILHNFENRVWAEEEIKAKGREFSTGWGKGLGVETINDDTIKLAQKMGYTVVVRRDPRKGYVRIKAVPGSSVDLTPVCERLKKRDPQATWFLHISKKMLLNGTAKNPKMRPTTLSLDDIINVLKTF
ncbi:MAG: hypothetical protein A2695_01275, partial [Candidatus Levybacteria bacterium RIFCSPHIGHO2_01_FULL_40_83]